MPSTTKRSPDRARFLISEGAGGESSGELPATPSEILETMPDDLRGKLPDDVVEQLLAGARTEEEIVGPGGLLSQLTKRLVERAMEVEITDHLGYETHVEPPGGAGNPRNGSTPKRLITEHGEVQINTPRDRDGSFEPRIVKKRQRRFEGFDDKILASYSRGLSTRDIEAHIAEIHRVHVGRDLISRVTDAVMDDARAWQQRPLDDVYPVVFLDALVLKIREGGSVQRKACYLALGVGLDGSRDVLGMWFSGIGGREVLDADPERAQVPWGRGHPDRVRRRTEGLSGGDRGDVPGHDGADVHRAPDPQQPEICAAARVRGRRPGPETDLHAIDADHARQELERFDEKWGARFLVITQAWLSAKPGLPQ